MEALLAIAAPLMFALLCAGIYATLRRNKLPPVLAAPKVPLIHSINDDRCTGCDACVDVCPTDVLELQGNKSRVARFGDCIQCEQCAWACPTAALVMHPRGTTPQPFRAPVLDDFYQAQPGLYLIGEAGGKPLVKNASNLGRAVVEHMVRAGGVRPCYPGGDEVDVLIVGSGPGGLSAALSCQAYGLSFAVLEKDELVASTIARYPKGKAVMAEPYDVECVGLLPVWDASKEELIAHWSELLRRQRIKVATREAVEEVLVDDESGGFVVRSEKRRYLAQRVVVAIGTRGRPRRLGVPGEELPKVSPMLDDPDRHAGARVLVVGGGDSAVEAAVALGRAGARTTLSYRGRVLSRCRAKNRQALDEAVRLGQVELRFGSRVLAIRDGEVALEQEGRTVELGNDRVFTCLGGDAPVKWLASIGVRFADQPHMARRAPTDRVVRRLVGGAPAERDQPTVVISLAG